eukprot:Sspe_Gene.52249::Locus_28949_Transcript_1_1_Confidence_1.000_Length_4027::g.52249::m.52249
MDVFKYILLVASILLAPREAYARRQFKMGFIYSGNIADLGWTNRHNDGRIMSQEALTRENPDIDVVSEVKEFVPRDFNKSMEAFNDFASRGFDLVVATSFVFHDATLAAAKKFPATNFVHISGFYDGPLNFVTAFGKLYQARYLGGVVAGATSRTGRVGYVASIPIPEVFRNVNAYYLGAKRSNASVEVIVFWINTFYDPDLEREAAIVLKNLGCDVIAYHTDSRLVPATAHESGIMSIGANADVRRLVGESVLTSAYFDWGPLYADLARRALNGSFTSPDVSHHLWYGYSEGVAASADLSFMVPSSARALYRAEQQRLLSGYDPFCEKLFNKRGVQVNKGCLSDGALLGMDYLLQDIYEGGEIDLPGRKCPRGMTYTRTYNYDALNYSLTCQECPGGTYSNFVDEREGSQECLPCNPGASSPPGSWECFLCPPGTYSETARSKECLPCPDGTSSTGEGNTGCPLREEGRVYLWVLIGVITSIAIVAPLAIWRFTANRRRLAYLYSNSVVAQKCAESIAAMRLEEVAYIREIPNPNRIQQAFIRIIDNLTEYRRYLPQSVLALADDNIEVGSEEEEEAVFHPRNPLVTPSRLGRPSEGFDSRASVQSAVSNKSQKSRGKQDKQQRLAAQLDLGVRERKGTLLNVEVNIKYNDVVKSFTMGSSFALAVLQGCQREEGMVLELRADVCLMSWNTHKPCPRHGLSGCRSALDIVQNLKGMGLGWWCMAVTSGKLLVGQVGDESRRAPFVLGNALTQAQQLRQLGRTLACRVLVSEAAHELTQAVMELRPVDVIANEEKTATASPYMVVYELLGLQKRSPILHMKYVRAFQQFRQNCFTFAASELSEISAELPTDYQVYRLLQLANWGKEDCEAFPHPYHRNFVGWQNYEAVVGVDKSGESMEATTVRHSVSSGHSPSNQVSKIMKGKGAEALKAEIEHARNGDRRSSDASSIESADHQLPGTFTDRDGSRWWRADKMLGKGAFGEVWLGMGEDGGLVALKLLDVPKQVPGRLRQQQVGSGQLDELLSEVSMLTKLHHENIVAVVSSLVCNQHVVVVMEFVPGGSLQTVLEQFTKLPLASVVRYSRDILRGLHFLHSHNVVHRDLKPGNVLLQIDGTCKLADFGAAAELSAASRNTTLGSPFYMAPEACRCQAEKKSDVWSFGISVFQLITGRIPWTVEEGEGAALIRFTRKLGKDDTMLPIIIDDDVGDRTAAGFIRACLVRDPGERAGVEDLLCHPFLLA